jgi:hypothetical protein
VRRALAPLRLESVVARCIAALDFWILFTVRLSRRPGPWIALHRLLSVPLLLRMDEHRLALDRRGGRIHVRCRARSGQLDWLLPDAAAASDGATAPNREPDLEIVQVHPWTAPWWRRRGWLMVAAFVRYQGHLDSVPPARPSKSLRGNLARASRSGFRPRPGGSDDWGRARAMAEAWARARFGSDVWLPPEHAWSRMRRHGRVIMIGDGARDVAIAIVVSAGGGGEAWLGPIGIAGGDHALLRAGALTAAYAAAVEEARCSGASTFDSGRCSSRIDDQIAAYKRRWGFRPTADPLSPLYALRARTPAGERFLAALPLWALGPGAALQRVGPS